VLKIEKVETLCKPFFRFLNTEFTEEEENTEV